MNKKLNRLKEAAENTQEVAEAAMEELFAYLDHIDEREKDPNFVHARMLFDEGWRATSLQDEVILWVASGEEDSPIVIEAKKLTSSKILKPLGLAKLNSSTKIMGFLLEITSEQDEPIPSNVS